MEWVYMPAVLALEYEKDGFEIVGWEDLTSFDGTPKIGIVSLPKKRREKEVY